MIYCLCFSLSLSPSPSLYIFIYIRILFLVSLYISQQSRRPRRRRRRQRRLYEEPPWNYIVASVKRRPQSVLFEAAGVIHSRPRTHTRVRIPAAVMVIIITQGRKAVYSASRGRQKGCFGGIAICISSMCI